MGFTRRPCSPTTAKRARVSRWPSCCGPVPGAVLQQDLCIHIVQQDRGPGDGVRKGNGVERRVGGHEVVVPAVGHPQSAA